MHFALLVIGPDPEAQLAPYSVHLEVQEYFTPLNDLEKELMTSFYGEKFKFNGTFDQCVELYAKEWCNDTFVKKYDTWYRRSTYNQQGKYDYAILGGRYSGWIVKKNGRKANHSFKKHITNLNGLIFAPYYGILDRGNWIEQIEDDTLWGIVVNEYLANADGDTLISVYDCHF